MVADVFEQPVAVLTKSNDVVPTLPPNTTPLGEIVAIVEFPPDQVPPVEGVKLILAPTQTCVGPPKTGSALITTFDVVSEQPEDVSKNLNVTLPGLTGEITPAFVTVAVPVANEVQVPPEIGESKPVLPIQTDAGEVKIGCGLTVTAEVVFEQVVVELVNVNCTDPGAIPVTKPAFVTLANKPSDVAQVPPVAGDKLIVPFTQTNAAAVTVGFATIVTIAVFEH